MRHLSWALASVALVLTVGKSQSAYAQTYTTLHSFSGLPDGREPIAGLVEDTNGNLYGTTYLGGAYQGGTVFKLDKNGNETVLLNFVGFPHDGFNPDAALVRDTMGNIYGVTSKGGTGKNGLPSCKIPPACGTIFKLDAAGKETVIFSFTGQRKGAGPIGLVMDAVGNFYGSAGSAKNGSGNGLIFKLNASGTYTVLHLFQGKKDGAYPSATLLLDEKDHLYGTTGVGGAAGDGTLFQMNDAGKETVLWNFKLGKGIFPSYVGLMRDAAGDFYGTTTVGGNVGKHCSQITTYGCGVVFRISRRSESVLYRFKGGADGAFPNAGVAMDQAGNLYGTTAGSGPGCKPGPDCGTVFRLDRDGKLTVLHTFGIQQGDGTNPQGTLLRDQVGALYGTTAYGGGLGYGTVFKLAP